jgi:hypothetical protein
MNTGFTSAAVCKGVDVATARAAWMGAVTQVGWTVGVVVRLAAAAVPFAVVCAIFSAV